VGEISEAEKEVFRAAAARRKAAGIKLGRFAFMADQTQIVSINEFWNGWVEALGKQHAVDYLLIAMRKADESLRRAIARRNS
jgi:hypothetical protein